MTIRDNASDQERGVVVSDTQREAGAENAATEAAPFLGGTGGVLSVRGADVGASRERQRRRRLRSLAIALGIPAAYMWLRILSGDPVQFGLPHIDPFLLVPMLFFGALLVLLVGTTIGAGRSPHVIYRPEQLTVSIDDVKGIDPVKEDVVRSLNLFLAHKTFASQMGGTPRRGLLFEGDPGTGKTFLAKAMAREAGVPFLFVSATSFQSMYYGATARKIRSYFKALRKVARQEGGAIGFIEEIDAIAMARGGLGATTLPESLSSVGLNGCGGLTALPAGFARPAGLVANRSVVSEGVGGVVNEMLVQMQSFDEPTGLQKFRTRLVDRLNLLLPLHRQFSRPQPPSTNILLIAATNRADNSGPGAAASGSVRPPPHVRASDQVGSSRDPGPLPDTEGTLRGARRGGAARPTFLGDPGLHASHAGAPAG